MPVYKLKDMRYDNIVVHIYGEYLTLIKIFTKNEYLVYKIVLYPERLVIREHLVCWRGYSPNFDSLIPLRISYIFDDDDAVSHSSERRDPRPLSENISKFQAQLSLSVKIFVGIWKYAFAVSLIRNRHLGRSRNSTFCTVTFRAAAGTERPHPLLLHN